jgi:hypothetical protein
VKIDGANSTPTLREEKTPEPYVLHSVWRFCDERQAALIGLAAFTGFRPQVFGNYRGNDGLRIEGLPELEIDNEHKKVTFKVIPTRVIVREESPSDSALIREPLADRNQFLQQHILEPSLRSVVPDCCGVNVNADQVRHLAKPDTP